VKEVSFFNHLRWWKLYSYFWKPALEELCRTCGFWSNQGYTILSNTRSAFHPGTRAALWAKPVSTQFISSSNLGAELPTTSTFHQQALWVAQCLMWYNSWELAVQARGHEAKHSPTSPRRKYSSRLTDQVSDFRRQHHPRQRQARFQTKTYTFRQPEGLKLLFPEKLLSISQKTSATQWFFNMFFVRTMQILIAKQIPFRNSTFLTIL